MKYLKTFLTVEEEEDVEDEEEEEEEELNPRERPGKTYIKPYFDFYRKLIKFLISLKKIG